MTETLVMLYVDFYGSVHMLNNELESSLKRPKANQTSFKKWYMFTRFDFGSHKNAVVTNKP